jgi:2-(1,2-epoxy-1,2-dihydrophenyl)acetyl-CoA isomerase
MDTYRHLQIERRGAVRVITLQRPGEANALDGVMAAELADAAAACDAEASVRAVVLTGSGRFFCAGGDVKAMAGFGDAAGREIKALADDLHRAIAAFSRMAAPLVIAVNGTAAGAGMSLAATGDLVVAAEAATFTMAYTGVGLSPDGSSTWFLPRLIGLRRTQELILTNRRLSAAEAQAWGLVTQVEPTPEQALAQAMQWAEALARGAPASHRSVKHLLLATFGNGLETQMELEGRAIAACAASPDGREGVAAFLERRAPRFGQ